MVEIGDLRKGFSLVWMRFGQRLLKPCRRHADVRWTIAHDRNLLAASSRLFRTLSPVPGCLILQNTISISAE
jgi:hypothetical protein